MKTLALSVSPSPEVDLRARGLLTEHLHHAWLELTRYVVDAGIRIAYGGDFRPDGFTEHLLSRVAMHRPADTTPRSMVFSYLAWPLYLDIPAKHRRRLLDVATVVPIPPPLDTGVNPSLAPTPDDPATPYAKARTLTAMRQAMTEATDARLMFGGRLQDYLGLWPGVVEEAYWCLRAHKPLYLLGGFGGASAAIIEALHGGAPESLTPERLRAHAIAKAPGGQPLHEVYESYGETELLEEDLITFFHRTGVSGLHNGLSEEQNEHLFTTVDPLDAAVLVLQGMPTT